MLAGLMRLYSASVVARILLCVSEIVTMFSSSGLLIISQLNPSMGFKLFVGNEPLHMSTCLEY